MDSTVDAAIEYLHFVTRHVYGAGPYILIMAIMIELGFSPDAEGFYYLCDSVELKVQDVNLHLSDLYQKIADRHDSSLGYFQIDQAIRSTMKRAWGSRKKEKWGNLFPDINMETGRRPSNYKFICYMACFVILLQHVRKEGSYEAK